MSDGGGKVAAVSRPLAGNTEVGRFLAAMTKLAPRDSRAELSELNAQPALLVFESDVLTNAFLFDASSEGITAIYVVRNPDKLKRLSASSSHPSH